MITASRSVVLSRVSSNVIVLVSVALLYMSIVANRRLLSTLPIGVAESGFVADGDQGDDDESAAHCWSPFGVVD